MKKLLTTFVFLASITYAKDYQIHITQIRNSTNDNSIKIYTNDEIYAINSYDIEYIDVRTDKIIKVINDKGLLAQLIPTDIIVHGRRLFISGYYEQNPQREYKNFSCNLVEQTMGTGLAGTINIHGNAGLIALGGNPLWLDQNDAICKDAIDKYVGK